MLVDNGEEYMTWITFQSWKIEYNLCHYSSFYFDEATRMGDSAGTLVLD